LTLIASADRRPDPQRGFALLEMLAALTIAGAVFALLAQFTNLSVHNWNRGESAIASMEMLTRGLGRLGADLTLALPMRPPGTDTPNMLFRGDPDRIQFVAATGFGAGDRGLELISVSVIKEENGIAVVRERAPVTTVTTPFRDPVVLLRGRLQVQFVYRDADGQTVQSWSDRPQLPRSVGVYVYNSAGLPVFPVPVQLNLPANLAASCLTGDDDSGGCPQDRQQQQRRQQRQQQQGTANNED
jgi:prepilin-type N-terminal cleavage/methylation domain-containing protein